MEHLKSGDALVFDLVFVSGLRKFRARSFQVSEHLPQRSYLRFAVNYQWANSRPWYSHHHHFGIP